MDGKKRAHTWSLAMFQEQGLEVDYVTSTSRLFSIGQWSVPWSYWRVLRNWKMQSSWSKGKIESLEHKASCLPQLLKLFSWEEGIFQRSSFFLHNFSYYSLPLLWGFSSFTSWVGILCDSILNQELISSQPVFSLSNLVHFPGFICWGFPLPFLPSILHFWPAYLYFRMPTRPI